MYVSLPRLSILHTPRPVWMKNTSPFAFTTMPEAGWAKARAANKPPRDEIARTAAVHERPMMAPPVRWNAVRCCPGRGFRSVKRSAYVPASITGLVRNRSLFFVQESRFLVCPAPGALAKPAPVWAVAEDKIGPIVPPRRECRARKGETQALRWPFGKDLE